MYSNIHIYTICHISTCAASLCKPYFHCYEIFGPWSLLSDRLFHHKTSPEQWKKPWSFRLCRNSTTQFCGDYNEYINHELRDPYWTTQTSSFFFVAHLNFTVQGTTTILNGQSCGLDVSSLGSGDDGMVGWWDGGGRPCSFFHSVFPWYSRRRSHRIANWCLIRLDLSKASGKS